MRVVIIEDEPLAQAELSRLLLRNFAQIDIVATLESVEESIEWLSGHRADLIFMDIHLADGISFEIFEKIELTTPVIFTTAYDHYAIRAFEVSGVGYLLKPIEEEKLVATVERFQQSQHHSAQHMAALIAQLHQPGSSYKSRLAIKLGDKISFLHIEDISYFYSEDRTTYAVERSGKRHIVDYNIERLESLLNPMNFFRVTRGCIASIGSIERVAKYFNSRLKVTLQPPYDKEVLISRVNAPKFVAWLDGE